MNTSLLLSEKCPCSSHVRDDFNAWITALFDTSDNESDVIKSFYAPKKQNFHRTDKFLDVEGVCKKETLGELLEHLESTFGMIKLPTGKESWIEKDEVIGIRKVGVHIPNPWRFEVIKDEEKLRIDRSKKLPSIVAIALLPTQAMKQDKNNSYQGITFAIRLRKPPYFVHSKDGNDYYKFGHAYVIDDKTYWLCMYVSIDAEGSITILDEFGPVETTINLKKRIRGGVKQIHFSRNGWRPASLLVQDDKPVDFVRKWEKMTFYNIIKWWSSREDRWNIVVKKNGERVTFSIDQSLSKDYFADRNITISKKTGKPMKIVHYVNAHDRNVNGKTIKVSEHIRGLREFDWKGFHCLVTAPKFTGHTTAFCDIEAEEFGEDEYIDSKKYVSTSKLGSVLAKHEEIDFRNMKKTSSNH